MIKLIEFKNDNHSFPTYFHLPAPPRHFLRASSHRLAVLALRLLLTPTSTFRHTTSASHLFSFPRSLPHSSSFVSHLVFPHPRSCFTLHIFRLEFRASFSHPPRTSALLPPHSSSPLSPLLRALFSHPPSTSAHRLAVLASRILAPSVLFFDTLPIGELYLPTISLDFWVVFRSRRVILPSITE